MHAGAAVAVLVVTQNWHVYVPALLVAALIMLASMLMLARQLPLWSIVDGLIVRSHRSVASGMITDVVEATTDVALKALHASLLALNDQGELQSCVFWQELVTRCAGDIVSESGGLYAVRGDGSIHPLVRFLWTCCGCVCLADESEWHRA